METSINKIRLSLDLVTKTCSNEEIKSLTFILARICDRQTNLSSLQIELNSMENNENVSQILTSLFSKPDQLKKLKSSLITTLFKKTLKKLLLLIIISIKFYSF